MNWNGTTLSLAPDCDIDEDRIEIVEIHDADSLIDAGAPCADMDDERLVEWIEKKLTWEDWSTLHADRQGDLIDEAMDR
jgi:hypothetical protein